jgi:hypothetical protein
MSPNALFAIIAVAAVASAGVRTADGDESQLVQKFEANRLRVEAQAATTQALHPARISLVQSSKI